MIHYITVATMPPLSNAQIDEQIECYNELYRQHQQDHVFHYRHELDYDQKLQLLSDCQHIDIQHTNNIYNTSLQQETGYIENIKSNRDTIEPFTDITYSNNAIHQQPDELYYTRGMNAIVYNKVGVVLMSGGSGTRLKSTLPKGMYDIGLLSHKSLFHMHSERIIRLQQLAQQYILQHNITIDHTIQINWYIMTSIGTHELIKQYFDENNYFNLNSSQIQFFTQDEIPSYHIDTGKILMNNKYRISMSPNGNGGIYSAMYKHGILKHMADHSIQYIHIYGIDNVLVKLCDPTFIGWFVSQQNTVDIGNKVVMKSNPHEKVGVMCRQNHQTKVLEYSEIPNELCESRDPQTNELLYGAANIAQHIFTLDILNKLSQQVLPYHIARKSIPYMDHHTNQVTVPTSINAIKLEMFIFDAFQYSNNIAAYAVDRSSEFSPVKNASGPGIVDSPATALSDITQYNTRLIQSAGGRVINENNQIVEISGLITYSGEGLQQIVNGKTYHAPVYIQ